MVSELRMATVIYGDKEFHNEFLIINKNKMQRVYNR